MMLADFTFIAFRHSVGDILAYRVNTQRPFVLGALRFNSFAAQRRDGDGVAISGRTIL
jgi:hypothetical protein